MYVQRFCIRGVKCVVALINVYEAMEDTLYCPCDGLDLKELVGKGMGS